MNHPISISCLKVQQYLTPDLSHLPPLRVFDTLFVSTPDSPTSIFTLLPLPTALTLMSIRPASPPPSTGSNPAPPPGALVLISGLTSPQGRTLNGRHAFIASLPTAKSRVAVLTVPRGLVHQDAAILLPQHALTRVAPAPAHLRLSYLAGVATASLSILNGPSRVAAAAASPLWQMVLRTALDEVARPGPAQAPFGDRSVTTVRAALARAHAVRDEHVESARVFRDLFADGSLGDGRGMLVPDAPGLDGVQLMRQEFVQELALAGELQEAVEMVSQMAAERPLKGLNRTVALEAAQMVFECAAERRCQEVQERAVQWILRLDPRSPVAL